jgi:hypothetical protein
MKCETSALSPLSKMHGDAKNIHGRKLHIFGPARQYPACRATTFYEVDMGFQATEVSGAPPTN